MSRRPSQKLLLRTLYAWQPLSREPLTENDAEEILCNTLALADLLKEIDENVTKNYESTLCSQRSSNSPR